MKEYTIHTPVQEYLPGELPAEDARLVEEARKMTASSHAPYSHFHVGAAILLADGTVVRGSNQENAAYPSGTCAERTACYQAGALFPGVPMRKIAIAAADDNGSFQAEPISPCGACRQALMEYEKLHGPIEVLLYGKNRTLRLPSVASLLPLTFTEF